MRIPDRITSRYPSPNFQTSFSTRSRNKNNVINIIANSSSANPRKEFVPSITLTNTMSLVPKIDEVIPFVEDNNTDLIFITETLQVIRSYNLICKNRSSGAHGVVCLYINNSIKFNVLEDLHDPDFEVLWVRITPTRPWVFQALSLARYIILRVHVPMPNPCWSIYSNLLHLSRSKTNS